MVFDFEHRFFIVNSLTVKSHSFLQIINMYVYHDQEGRR